MAPPNDNTILHYVHIHLWMLHPIRFKTAYLKFYEVLWITHHHMFCFLILVALLFINFGYCFYSHFSFSREITIPLLLSISTFRYASGTSLGTRLEKISKRQSSWRGGGVQNCCAQLANVSASADDGKRRPGKRTAPWQQACR